jgi:hypothetical protein
MLRSFDAAEKTTLVVALNTQVLGKIGVVRIAAATAIICSLPNRPLTGHWSLRQMLDEQTFDRSLVQK